MDWKEVITIVIAVVVAWIALQQWRTEDTKLRLDLFERRATIYNAILDVIWFVTAHGQMNEVRRTEFIRSVGGAKFLLGDEIHRFIDEMQYHIDELMDATKDTRKEGLSGTALELALNREDTHKQWLRSRREKVDELFAEFLGMVDRPWFVYIPRPLRRLVRW